MAKAKRRLGKLGRADARRQHEGTATKRLSKSRARRARRKGPALTAALLAGLTLAACSASKPPAPASTATPVMAARVLDCTQQASLDVLTSGHARAWARGVASCAAPHASAAAVRCAENAAVRDAASAQPSMAGLQEAMTRCLGRG